MVNNLNKKQLSESRIISIEKKALDIYRYRLTAPNISQSARSGNFINVEVPHCEEIMWRRPFSIHNSQPDAGTFDILFAAIGRGTHALLKNKPGDSLNIIGPLGNSFDYPDDLQEAIIVAGGIGIAPFLLMMQELPTKDIKKSIFYGAGTREQLCCLDDFEKTNAEIHISTDDGSAGYKGFITDILNDYLASLTSTTGKQLYVCGPTPMMVKVQQLAKQYNISAQVTVENVMACGFGACMGCPVPMANPPHDGKKYLLACKDGPVFNMNEINLND